MAEKITRATKTTPVRAYPHPSDSRANIPTAELESFARPEEKRPATVRYPRDPTLDPQLVWKGKDEQDAHDLEVPAVPIYIQETIDPLALIEELRAESTRGGARVSALTARELETARLVVDRKTNSAAELFLSQKTVETHLRNMFNKLGVAKRVELAHAVAAEQPLDSPR